MRKPLGFLLLTLLIVSIPIPFSVYATWQGQVIVEERVKAEKFIEIAQHAYEITINFRDLVKERGIDTTKANEIIGEGEALLKEAKDYLEKGEYNLAFEKARSAQERFRNAIKTLTTPLKEDEEEKGKGILEAIERIEERIERINDVIANIKETQENKKYIDWVKGNLTEAQKNLNEAREAIKNKNVSTAAQLLGKANKDIEEALRALRLIEDWIVSWRIESFFKGIEKLLDNIRNLIERLAKEKVDVSELMKMLDNAKGLIESAKSKLLSGDKKGALNDIKEAREILQDILKAITKKSHIPKEQPKVERLALKQNLANAPNKGAAVWDHTTITILIKPNVYSPNSNEVSAGRKAIDRWKASLIWFSTQDWNNDTLPDYPWLSKINFIIYVQGVNETLIKTPPDITITYYHKIAPSYVLGSTRLSFKKVGENYAIRSVDIIIGVRGLNTIGIENLVAHEFGHALGLEHSDVKGDLMYPSFDMSEERVNIVSPSTLNLYSLAISYSWLKTEKFSQYHSSLSITLPEYIPYQRQ